MLLGQQVADFFEKYLAERRRGRRRGEIYSILGVYDFLDKFSIAG